MNLDTDNTHCGSCDVACFAPQEAVAVCQNHVCALGPCNPGHADCNGISFDGCEHNLLADGPCVCVPGTTQPCYQGFPGTENNGPCKSGARICKPDGAGFGACTGQVLPIFEICGNGVDDDCNGAVDDVTDIDGDGWTMCDGDCCEVGAPNCPYPQLVNPGAYEILNNGVDDDCDPTTNDNVPAVSCASAEVLSGVTGVEVAKAMDLCQLTTAAPPLAQKRWGVVSASQILPDGSAPTAADLADIQGYQTAILASFGNVIVPHKNGTMAALSTGHMRDPAHAGYVDPSPGTSFGRVGAPPAGFLAAHGGLLPSSTSCNGACPHGAGAYDGVGVRLTIRTPTNAKSFSYDYRFFTGEYGARGCSAFNDYHLALYQSAAPGIPLDHNIAFDTLLNLPSVDSAHFDVCAAQGCSACPYGAGELAGTGFDVGGLGAATQWLTIDAPVVPGETIKLDLLVFDVSDGAGDSAVLLDNFRWNSGLPCNACP
ncbi:MAG: MopE-related protein [Byssovorax sp.]